MSDEQIERLVEAIESLMWPILCAGALIWGAIMFNGCMHK